MPPDQIIARLCFWALAFSLPAALVLYGLEHKRAERPYEPHLGGL